VALELLICDGSDVRAGNGNLSVPNVLMGKQMEGMKYGNTDIVQIISGAVSGWLLRNR